MTGTTEQQLGPDARTQGTPISAPRMDADRERSVTTAFVSIANNLATGHDLIELYIGLTADCARILDVASAALLLADRRGVLQVVAASAERTRDLELFMLGTGQGPCLDCYRTGTAVSVADLAAETARWPNFAPVAVEAGFASVHAVPMRLQDTRLGVLGLFGARAAALSGEDLSLAQALADVASVALVTGKAATDKTALAEQLQGALDSRVVLEQAKGILAQAGDLDTDAAFVLLRHYSRDNNVKLTELARTVASRELPPELILNPPKLGEHRKRGH
jgi:transcriptional regulator with GAF, ATPase, and Fis domain